VQAAPRPAPADGRKVTVQAGDTAGKIAATNKPASVSLDQMLVALLRANPDAFIAGNINRIKAGAVLDLPSAEQAALVEAGEASRTVVAQSRDFNEFRRKLAEGVPAAQVAAADRQASGKLQAKVEDKKPAAAAPDKLTLSKAAVQAKAAEDKIAKERQAKEAAARVAELNKNIAELNRLGTATAAAPAAAATPPASPAATAASKPAVAAAAGTSGAATPTGAPAASAPAPVSPAVATAAAVPASAAVAVAASASAPAPAAAPSAPAPAATPAPVAAPKPPAPKPAPAPEPEPSFVDDLLGNPLIPAAVGGLLALVLGFVFYRVRQRKKSTQVDSSFLESRLQPDSFFGASGGQRIDTNEGGPTGSSMVYSPSQLDAAGDVDPVAEADVYLAYGRDLQAEEILKEALRTNPQRVAIHGKLLEIYSKRRDAKAFEMVATDAYSLTRGEGPDWEHICELGQELDPSNPMYRPGGQPTGGTGTVAMAAVSAGSGHDFAMATATHVLPTGQAYQGWQSQPGGPHGAGPPGSVRCSHVRRAEPHRPVRGPHRRRRARLNQVVHLDTPVSANPSPGCAAPTASCRRHRGAVGRAGADDFHARNSARGRRYAYVLLESAVRPRVEAGPPSAGCSGRWTATRCAGRRAAARRA
jgi:pilus assembly protein FimV